MCLCFLCSSAPVFNAPLTFPAVGLDCCGAGTISTLRFVKDVESGFSLCARAISR
ncbi:hypothetical protein PF008_g28227 [Phytophthora fragariae]|uniref:Uncharacterized protein n=1 Tax=Phytophthora fragariae TaxID=53985 RepID=A0A6G0QC14_9STRA|nr:hypothetical protein PF008_g28227 [Phytophthora fragariae]